MRIALGLSRRACGLLTVGVWLIVAPVGAAAESSSPTCRGAELRIAPRAIDEVIAAARRAVPSAFSSMTNQEGRGAWRGYVISEAVSLQQDTASAEVRRFRRIAAARCGTRIAWRAWAVVIDFPYAQSVLYGRSTAFFLFGGTRWRFWFDTGLSRRGW